MNVHACMVIVFVCVSGHVSVMFLCVCIGVCMFVNVCVIVL